MYKIIIEDYRHGDVQEGEYDETFNTLSAAQKFLIDDVMNDFGNKFAHVIEDDCNTFESKEEMRETITDAIEGNDCLWINVAGDKFRYAIKKVRK